jgi:hypothetical protein
VDGRAADDLADPGREVREVPAMRQEPLVVRMSSQESMLKEGHSSSTWSSGSMRGPASRMTVLMPFWASSLPKVPPAGPGADNDDDAIVAAVKRCAHMCLYLPLALAPAVRRLVEPVYVVEAAVQVAALVVGRPS